MPYITSAERARWTAALQPLQAAITADTSVGELNYLLTLTVKAWLDAQAGANAGKVRYAHLNNAVGALESAKAELQRRVVAPYEDAKIAENGDVY